MNKNPEDSLNYLTGEDSSPKQQTEVAHSATPEATLLLRTVASAEYLLAICLLLPNAALLDSLLLNYHDAVVQLLLMEVEISLPKLYTILAATGYPEKLIVGSTFLVTFLLAAEIFHRSHENFKNMHPIDSGTSDDVHEEG
ncbi:hypothetical protein KA082_00650 [Candidatus Woesebacteria bacterium]|nr:hypothetical protein [Candidatus Woesebacteria bacterium]